jgi:hypothetical protein
MHHMVMPSSANLFQRAIVESGPAEWYYHLNTSYEVGFPSNKQSVALGFGVRCNIKGSGEGLHYG